MSFESLWSMRLKDQRDTNRDRAEAEYNRLLDDGFSDDEIARVYSSYRSEFKRQHGSDPEEERYAQGLAKWLSESFRIQWNKERGREPGSFLIAPGSLSVDRSPGQFQGVLFGRYFPTSEDVQKLNFHPPVPPSVMGQFVDAGLIGREAYREDVDLYGRPCCVLVE